MKTYLIVILTSLLANHAISQGKFSASISATGNIITFSLKPNATISTGFSTIEFFIRYPAATTFTYGAISANTINFPGMSFTGTVGSGSWEIERNNPLYMVAGYNVDHFIYTAPAPVTNIRSYIGGTVYDVIRVPVIGINPYSANIQFVHQNTEEKYYLAITSDTGGDLRPTSLADYFYPMASVMPGPSASTLYIIPLVSLPLNIISFNIDKKNRDVLLTWTVENQNGNSSHFEIEKSLDGVTFHNIGSVNINLLNGGAGTYTFRDASLDINKSSLIYYRIKQVDRDNKFFYTMVRTVNMSNDGFTARLHPNPSSQHAMLSFYLSRPQPVNMTISDARGNPVQIFEIPGITGMNQSRINVSQLPVGIYNVTLRADGFVETLKLVKIH